MVFLWLLFVLEGMVSSTVVWVKGCCFLCLIGIVGNVGSDDSERLEYVYQLTAVSPVYFVTQPLISL